MKYVSTAAWLCDAGATACILQLRLHKWTLDVAFLTLFIFSLQEICNLCRDGIDRLRFEYRPVTPLLRCCQCELNRSAQPSWNTRKRPPARRLWIRSIFRAAITRATNGLSSPSGGRTTQTWPRALSRWSPRRRSLSNYKEVLTSSPWRRPAAQLPGLCDWSMQQ
jgi:hypothetical protein